MQTKIAAAEIDRTPTAAELAAHEAEDDDDWTDACNAMLRAEAAWIDGYATAESQADLDLFDSQFPNGYR